jgi:hypothetical protein
MYQGSTTPFQVVVQKIIGQNTLSGTVNLQPTAAYYQIDSTVADIWLPDDAIQVFVENFGPTYDNKTEMFLINDTMRRRMLSLNPTITFFTANDTTIGGPTQNIQLPYAAFDLEASYPYYENATRYFPIRRAAHSSQYFIGRTLLQEAYLIADYQRGNFTLAQASFENAGQENIVAIEPPPASGTSLATPISSKGLSAGAIAGIVIGAVFVLALAGILLWYLSWNKRQKPGRSRKDSPETVTVLPNKQEQAKEGTAPKPELPFGHAVAEVPDSRPSPHELAAPKPLGPEVEGDLGRARSRPGRVEMVADEGWAHELPGSEP